MSNYMRFMLFWLLYEWNVNVSAAHPAIEISLTHKPKLKSYCHIAQRIISQNYVPSVKFQIKSRTYGHDFVAYERDARGRKFAPGLNLLPGANLHPVQIVHMNTALDF